ncbi:hypothetical protein ACCI51_08460 [Microbulbifer echini]|uniref:DUF1737 domain-containing protein n=1 Tax=Microbulbifer echini TaxID=1529067 RepID=A0ABV4NNH3_9GAMM
MKKAEYKVAVGKSGFSSLEEEVTRLLNEGWKPIGGLAFNAGYPYQAMARVVSMPKSTSGIPAQSQSLSEQEPTKKQPLGAQDAMRLVDELT